ncbi:type 2 periplasmic-binding domain-containing protein [Falsiroseomonas selenitidurans]|uniref:ABC transporter substrate-binding protein n=1 Tax=Falsiroseomonas selenitidurans TaxID=2716335 RepID=A0ABX1E146_9PROT|nr:ABC transporter substrate-binding protein [Falsiroseomonas selenitidurans]NKC30771.1 ABC transporter substrate-binding protein [Falsiroseomonas selenitidurans]
MTRLTLACTRSDRTQPVLDGRIPIAGFEIAAEAGEPEDLFRTAMREARFEITELSMASHILSVARGDSRYIGVPVFPSRAFRHSAIYIRTDRGIEGPEDLGGRTIGVPEYQQTAAMWVRGMLRTYYNVPMRSIAWRSAGERTPLDLPKEIDMQVIPAGESLEAMLADGRIDAFIGPRPPSCFLDGSAPVARLFPDSRAEEEAYLRATTFFPIMHCIAIRRDVAAAHPALPRALFEAFDAAKRQAVAELAMVNVLRVSLPWIAAEAAAQTAMMGGDPWPYGFTRNRAELQAMCRFAQADGLTARPVPVEELFETSTHGT